MSEHAAEQLAAVAKAAGIGVEELVGLVAGAVVFGMVRTLVDAGVKVSTALRLTSFLILDGTGGRGAVQSIGLSDRAARTTRAEIREAMAAVELSDEMPPTYLAEWSAAMEDRMRWAATGPAAE
jgi:hypothetical protein